MYLLSYDDSVHSRKSVQKLATVSVFVMRTANSIIKFEYKSFFSTDGRQVIDVEVTCPVTVSNSNPKDSVSCRTRQALRDVAVHHNYT